MRPSSSIDGSQALTSLGHYDGIVRTRRLDLDIFDELAYNIDY